MRVQTLTCVFSACLPLIVSGLLSLTGCGTSQRVENPYPYVNEDMGSSSDPDMGSGSIDMMPAPDPRFIVPPSDWQVEHPVPHFGWISHIFPISQNDAWLAGDYGTLLHWDGAQLTRMPQITTSSLYEVWSDGPNNVWAIGSAGVVIRYDGTTWKPVPIDDSMPLTSIWGSSANDIWVTAANDGFFSKSGRLFHWDGSKFSKTMDTSAPLFNVYGRSQSDVWIAGYYGTAMHYDGGQWNLFSPRVADKDLNGVWAASANDVWFVGDSGTSLHWNGSTFTSVATNLPSPIFGGPPDLWSVSGVAANNLWAIGGGSYLIHSDGTKWDPYITPPIEANSVWHRAANDVWVAGQGIDRYNGTTFAPLLPGTHRVQGLFGTSPTDIYTQSEALMRRDSSGKWNKVTLPNNTPLIVMWASSTSDIWVVNSSRQYFRYNGSTWSQRTITSPTSPTYFSSVHAVSPTDTWIADTSYNNQLFRFNGSTYTQYSVVGAGGNEKFGPLWGSASNDVWSAGSNSDFYHWNGTIWSPVVTGITPAVTWRGIHGSAANDIWFVADGGKVGHYDGTSFTVSNSPAQLGLNGVFALGPSDVWAVGNSGAILHYDGRTWSPMESGTRNNLTAVWALSSGDVWAAGENGLTLHLKR